MAIGIPWCRQEDYDAFRAIFEDRRDLPLAWNEFIQRAQHAEKFWQDQGRIVERVDIDPKIFPTWCAENGHGVNAYARTTFAYLIAVSRHPNDQSHG